MNRISISKGKRAKKSNKGKKTVRIIFIIIILVLLVILGIKIYNQDKAVTPPPEETSQVEQNELPTNTIVEPVKTDEIVSVEDMPNKMGNYTVIGQIVIEKIGVSKYILDRTTNNSLDLAVTKFKGPEINKVGNFCITGHNYKGIFKRLKELEKGDEFYLIGKDGRKVTYVIYDKFSINPENEECLSQQTNGKREVTLITCDPGAVTRLILKADEKI